MAQRLHLDPCSVPASPLRLAVSPELSFSLTLYSGHLVLHHHHSSTSISQSRSQTKPISDCPIRLDELVLNSSPPHLQFDTIVVQSTTHHLQTHHRGSSSVPPPSLSQIEINLT
ncbi:hypothetical protein M0R45_025471 [Rubus argutus]|uniref:Uncharacterized protein n=1 Tax=Rubus argutus TaxID=59490 RepID=A0AAW1W8Q3_RUBAR